MTNPTFSHSLGADGTLRARLDCFKRLRDDVDVAAVIRALLDLQDRAPLFRMAWLAAEIRVVDLPDGSARYLVTVPPYQKLEVAS